MIMEIFMIFLDATCKEKIKRLMNNWTVQIAYCLTLAVLIFCIGIELKPTILGDTIYNYFYGGYAIRYLMELLGTS